MNIRIVVCALAVALALPAGAGSIYPDAVEACLADAMCTAPEAYLVAPDFEVYRYAERGAPAFLLRYALGPGAAENATPLTGALWVGVRGQYDLAAGSHPIALYFDKVSPLPTNLWVGDSDGLDVQVLLPTDALLAGGGHYRLADQGPAVIGMGSLGDRFAFPFGDLPESFLPCVAATCEVEALFRMAGYHYAATGGTAELVVTPGTAGGLVYRQRSYYAGDEGGTAWDVVQTYSTVPLPGAAGVFLVGLALALRRR